MIKTKRLILRPLEMKDANDLYLYFNDEAINKYLYKQRNSDLEEIKSFIKRINKDNNYHCFGIQYKEKIIGDISISFYNGYGEIAWAINSIYQNQGFALEASKKYIEYIFNNYDIKTIKAHCDINNKSSKCLIQKLGFEYLFTNPRIYEDGRKQSFEEEYQLKYKN